MCGLRSAVCGGLGGGGSPGSSNTKLLHGEGLQCKSRSRPDACVQGDAEMGSLMSNRFRYQAFEWQRDGVVTGDGVVRKDRRGPARNGGLERERVWCGCGLIV
jgi:hypothetical protein